MIFVADSESLLHNIYKLGRLLKVKPRGIGINNSYSEYGNSLKRLCESKKKARISIAIDREFLTWIDQMIRTGVFASRSHAIHRALLKLKEEGAN